MRRGVEAGTEWTGALASAIKPAKIFLYFVTPDSTRSENCRKEVSFALEQKLPVIAVHLEETDLPDGLSLTPGQASGDSQARNTQ
jgi:hypothetical protein